MRNSNTQSVSSNLGIGGEKYPDTHQLLQLDQYRRQGRVPDELKRVESPLVVSQWSSLLKDHPDKQFAQYVLTGIAEGFRIGFDYVRAECRSAQSNLRSAESNPDVVATYLAGCLGHGHPESSRAFRSVHLESYLRVTPRGNGD